MTSRSMSALGLALALLVPASLIPGASALASPRPVSDDAKAKGDHEGAQKAIEKAMKAAQGGDLDAATVGIEEAVKLDPQDRRANYLLAAILQTRANQAPNGKPKYDMMIRSAKAMRTLKAIDGSLKPNEKPLYAQATYNEACAYALDGKADQAVAALTESIDSGFSDAKTFAADEDLASIRDRPEVAKLTEKLKVAAKKAEDAQKAAMVKQDEMMAKEMLPKLKEEMKTFKPFPFSFALPDLNGKEVKLADFKGKVTIVDVWGTWCPPCRMEIPHFVALRAKYKDKGFDIVGINYENGPKAAHKGLIESFAKENGVTYTCVLGDEKTRDQIPEFQGYPTTLFIDRAGKVRLTHVGYAPLPVLEEIVKTLLADDAGKSAAR